MSNHLLPPNPCLVAVILIVKTASEPQLVFHYPPRPGEDNSHFRDIFKDDPTDSTSSTSSSDESESSSVDEEVKTGDQKAQPENGASPPDMDEAGSTSPVKGSVMRPDQSKKQWNDLFGYQSGVIAKLLTPAASNHKKRFEMGLGDKVFLGWPLFAKPDGAWRKKRKARRSSSRSNAFTSSDTKRGIAKQMITSQVDTEMDETSGTDTVREIDEPSLQPGEIQQGDENSIEESRIEKDQRPQPIANSSTISSDGNGSNHEDSLTMFHVVFILSPPPLEYHLRTKEMYDHVVKKFSRALKYEQARSNYVAKQASLITAAAKRVNKGYGGKPPLATLYHELISHSSLAKALSTLYNSISLSRIAHMSLTPTLSLSLQIPIPISISVLPSPLEPQQPGLWLTTATSLPMDDDIQATSSQLGGHFTLLLLADLPTILADVKATPSAITEPLTDFLQVCQSTKSFYQISQSSGMPLVDIQFLASHLIYWRRARAIPPLKQRDTYIVSPNADLKNLASAASSFAKKFPTFPSLPKILSLLSSTPRPYLNIIPSKDHKPAYMDILALLLRGGWVTQLRTFGWVRVPPHIKDAVLKTAGTGEDDGDGTSDAPDSGASKTQLDLPNLVATSPTSSIRTAIPIPESRPPPSPTLIPNPRLASSLLPSRYLYAISAHILAVQGEDSQAAWNKCVRYFDGKHAIQTIAGREGWKRKRVADLVAGWEGLGVLIRGRHW